jgi:hypothetical protein
MNLERWYMIKQDDWALLETQFRDSYIPVLKFVTENKGSFSEARDVYIEAFYYYTRSIELKGADYLEKSTDLIYSFSRIIWLRKLEKRKVDLSMIKHQREFYDLDETFHEIDLMSERSEKAWESLAKIGEPCRTLVLEVIGHGEPLLDVAQRLGFADEERAKERIIQCIKKLILLAENHKIEDDDSTFESCLTYALSPSENERPQGAKAEVCLAITSRTLATIKNYVNSKERTATLREFRDRLLQSDASALQEIESKPKVSQMKPLQLAVFVALLAIAVSGLTSFVVYQLPSSGEVPTASVDTTSTKTDTIDVVPVVTWHERSAFLINDDGFALTSAKDLTQGQRVQAGDHEIQNEGATVVAIDPITGIALLKVDSALRTTVPFRFSTENPTVGDELISLGFKEGKLLYSAAETQHLEGNVQWISGNTLLPGAPLLSEIGELKGIVTEDTQNPTSIGVVDLAEFISNHVVDEVHLPRRNRLYYDSTSKKVEKISPCILKIKFHV